VQKVPYKQRIYAERIPVRSGKGPLRCSTVRIG